METKDTSFIPQQKASSLEYRPKKPANFVVYSFIILVISGLLFGGAYFYKQQLIKRSDVLKESINRAQFIIDPALLNELTKVSGKIDSAKLVLSQHTSLLPIFSLLEKVTLKSVRFSNFSFSFSAEGVPTVNLIGDADSYSSLALQMDSFNKNSDIKGTSLSDMILGQSGRIKFNVSIKLDPSFIIYKSNVQ